MKIFRAVLLIMIPFFLTGCVAVLLGAGAAGGYAVSKDSIQGETDKDFDSIYANAFKIADTFGTVDSETKNSSVARITAKVDNASLEIDIERLTRQTVMLKVKSRKNLMPNIELAQKVYTKILQQSR